MCAQVKTHTNMASRQHANIVNHQCLMSGAAQAEWRYCLRALRATPDTALYRCRVSAERATRRAVTFPFRRLFPKHIKYQLYLLEDSIYRDSSFHNLLRILLKSKLEFILFIIFKNK